MNTPQAPFVGDVRQIIQTARTQAVRSVDFARVQMYWHIGRRIVEEEQGGLARAGYGKRIIRNLAEALLPEYGSGFGVRQLERARKFFMLFPIASTLRTQLNWSQYKLLVGIDDKDKREYYELESVNNAWTSRQLERQINSMLYERLLLSNDKNDTAVRMTLPEDNSTILASRYQLYMPTVEQLERELEEAQRIEQRRKEDMA